MKIVEVKHLDIPGVAVIRVGRFSDSRGYFSETFRKSDTFSKPELDFLRPYNFVQTNESYSRAGVVKGLHFQWEPPLGKLLRTISGHMVDMVLDIRKGSPTLGKIILYDLPSRPEQDYNDWIWLPPGVAHGSFFLADSLNEYFFTADYNPAGEAGISPLSEDLDWSLSDPARKSAYDTLKQKDFLISDKDRNSMNFTAWQLDSRSEHFVF
jgi:dTDP-4-dehydrorhamnose 3,5-epimerase